MTRTKNVHVCVDYQRVTFVWRECRRRHRVFTFGRDGLVRAPLFCFSCEGRLCENVRGILLSTIARVTG